MSHRTGCRHVSSVCTNAGGSLPVCSPREVTPAAGRQFNGASSKWNPEDTVQPSSLFCGGHILKHRCASSSRRHTNWLSALSTSRRSCPPSYLPNWFDHSQSFYLGLTKVTKHDDISHLLPSMHCLLEETIQTLMWIKSARLFLLCRHTWPKTSPGQQNSNWTFRFISTTLWYSFITVSWTTNTL